MLELLAGIVLAAGGVYVVLRPVLRPAVAGRGREDEGAVDEGADPEDDLSPRAVALRALKEIEFDRATGKLADVDYDALKAKYTAEALAALRAEGEPRGGPPPPPPPAPAGAARSGSPAGACRRGTLPRLAPQSVLSRTRPPPGIRRRVLLGVRPPARHGVRVLRALRHGAGAGRALLPRLRRARRRVTVSRRNTSPEPASHPPERRQRGGAHARSAALLVLVILSRGAPGAARGVRPGRA
jgi:hypothetical protein